MIDSQLQIDCNAEGGLTVRIFVLFGCFVIEGFRSSNT